MFHFLKVSLCIITLILCLIQFTAVNGQNSTLGSSCNETTDCRVKYSECVNKTCQCVQNYEQKNSECLKETEDVGAIGDACNTSSDCTTAFSDCIIKKCSCKPGYREDGRQCIPELNERGCLSNEECDRSMPNSECKETSSGKKCVCLPDFSNSNGNCIRYLFFTAEFKRTILAILILLAVLLFIGTLHAIHRTIYCLNNDKRVKSEAIRMEVLNAVNDHRKYNYNQVHQSEA